jgi:hypothetical protein
MRRIALAPLLAVTGCNWMRRIALAPLLAVTGCNWVFGLDATIEIDAAPVSELPPGPRTKLVWGIATTDGMPAAPGIDPVVEYKPIGSEPLYPAPPMIQVGDDSGLAPATYDSTDGSFEIPYPLRESPHRIVYTLPGESVPHEVQWALTGATLVVPRTTRADAPKPPANSGYTITPTGLAGSLSAPIAFTSGVFTATDEFSAFEQTGAAITFRYAASAKPLAGPSGAPQGGKGDWVLLTEWVPRGNTQTSVYGWALAREVDLVANMMTSPASQPAWTTGDRTLSQLGCPGINCLPSGNVAQTGQRLDNVLGSLGGTDSARMAYGAPLMLAFLESSSIDGSITLADPTASLGLKPVVFSRLATSRTVGGVQLTSAIQAVTDVFSGSIQYGAPLATNIKLGDISLSVDQADNVMIPASSGPIRLKFETEAGYSADDFVITLYEINATSLAPVRIYHVIQPEVKIDGTLLASGHTYVFGITARSGFGGADRGDYQKAQYPFGSTTTFPRTFTIQ